MTPSIVRPVFTRTRPIDNGLFTDTVRIVRVNDSRNKHGEPVEERQTLDPTKCSTNPIAADDERLGQLQQSGVRLVGLREFFTQEPMSVDFKDEFLWDGKYYVAIQTADWGYYHSTLAALKEGQQDGNPNT